MQGIEPATSAQGVRASLLLIEATVTTYEDVLSKVCFAATYLKHSTFSWPPHMYLYHKGLEGQAAPILVVKRLPTSCQQSDTGVSSLNPRALVGLHQKKV